MFRSERTRRINRGSKAELRFSLRSLVFRFVLKTVLESEVNLRDAVPD